MENTATRRPTPRPHPEIISRRYAREYQRRLDELDRQARPPRIYGAPSSPAVASGIDRRATRPVDAATSAGSDWPRVALVVAAAGIIVGGIELKMSGTLGSAFTLAIAAGGCFAVGMGDRSRLWECLVTVPIAYFLVCLTLLIVGGTGGASQGALTLALMLAAGFPGMVLGMAGGAAVSVIRKRLADPFPA